MLSATLLHDFLTVKTIASAFAVYWITWIVYARTLHPYAKYPGPFLASISRLWIVIRAIQGDADKVERSLHERFGRIVRIAPDQVAISDPDAIKTIYSVGSGFYKTDFALAFRGKTNEAATAPDHFTNVDEKWHGERRRIVSSVYSMSNVVKTEQFIDNVLDTFMDRMGEFSEKKGSFDLTQWVQMYAFDVLGELFFGKMFGFLEEGKDYGGFIEALEALVPLMATCAVMPRYIRPVVMIAGILVVPSVKKGVAALNVIEDAADACLQKRLTELEQGKARQDLLGKLFDIYHERKEGGDYKIIDVKQEIYTALFAGTDTTATAIASILFHLLKHPAVYKRLTDEIDEASKCGRLSPHIRLGEAIALPYLDACCKEGMRVHPAVGWTLPRHVPKGGCSIAGAWFPAGSKVGVNAAVVHFDKGVFGDDADSFNPDRWLRDGAEGMDRYMFQFGSGPRTCIAKNISICEIYKLVPQLLRSYDLTLTDPERNLTSSNRFFNKPFGIQVSVRKRHAQGT